MKIKMQLAGFATASILLAAPAAYAGSITTYTDLGAFTSALGATPVTLETFGNDTHFPITTGILNSSTTVAGITPGLIQPGVTYSTPIGVGNFFNIDCCSASNNTPFLDTVTANGPLTVTFDNDTLAFGFMSGFFNNGLSVTINFASDSPYSNTFVVGGADTFWGFKSSAADIQSVVIGGSTNAFTFAIDDFRFTSATAPVPEPETYAMMLAGLGMLGWIQRRRKQRVTA